MKFIPPETPAQLITRSKDLPWKYLLTDSSEARSQSDLVGLEMEYSSSFPSEATRSKDDPSMPVPPNIRTFIVIETILFLVNVKVGGQVNDLDLISRRSRILAVLTAHRNGDGHLSSSCSQIEILTAIIQSHKNVFDSFPRIILSKGHGALGFYCVLSEFGYLDSKELLNYGVNGSNLMSHPQKGSLEQIELSTGSLGMGLGFAAGIALAKKQLNSHSLIHVVMGDGETNEGSVWESAIFASARKLNNLRLIVDHNKIQAVAKFEEVSGEGSLRDKFEAFGWDALEVNGNDLAELKSALRVSSAKPLAIIAHTSGSKTFPYDSDSVLWHYRRPSDEDLLLFSDKLEIPRYAKDLLELFK